MNTKERLLALKHVVKAIVDPKTVGVIIAVADKDFNMHSGTVFHNTGKPKDAYLNYIVGTMVSHARSSSGLYKIVWNHLVLVQELWNEQNPDDPINIMERVSNV